MNKFEFFNKFNNSVIVVNKKGEVEYANIVFKRIFADFTTLKRFSHQLNFEACNLYTDNIDLYSPINLAIKSEQNFFTTVSYQSSKKETMYFNVTAYKRKGYTIFLLDDITAQRKLESIQDKYHELQKKYDEQVENNKNYVKIRQQAQTQAIKMALINKVSNSIRESIDINIIISSALKELRDMLGGFKAYYATKESATYKIREINKEYKSEQNKYIRFDERTTRIIHKNEISALTCIKEYSGAQNLKKSALRVIIPIYHLNEQLGIIVILTHTLHALTDEKDILESVSAQLANAIIQAQLYEKNIETVAELKVAMKELKDTQLQLINSEKMASLGQLIAGVAHEINTPLASINSNNSIIAKIIKKIDDENLSEMLNDINTLDKEAISRISNIVKSLKKFVRLDEAELQEANINKEIDLTLELIRHETKNRIEVVKDYSDIPMIKCYPNMLNQVFMNILINACQSIVGNGKIIVSTAIDNDNLTVKFKDSGKGISQENINKIFTAGYTTKGVGVGTGLGLAISQKIIQKHKGKILVTSEPGKGSEFTITIPR